MGSIAVLIGLGGAVALLLFGLREVREGITAAFGLRLKLVLGLGTRTVPRAFLSGLVATLGLQSSTATALMTAGFVERDMIRRNRAQVVMLGANLGTALTAWVVAAGIEAISPFLILAGYVLRRQSRPATAGVGRALTGVGLMLLALVLLTQASAPMRDSPALGAFLGLLGGALPVAFGVAAVLAVLCSSSLAVVMLILSLNLSGELSPALAVALVLGANLGGAIPPVLATLGSAPAARRVTIGNLIVRAAGCIVALPFAGIFGDWLQGMGLRAGSLPVEAHLAFNLGLAALALPFVAPLTEALSRALPDTAAEGEEGPRWLDEEALEQPAVALVGASREALAIGDRVERMMTLTATAFRRNEAAPLVEVARIEDEVDKLQQAVKLYLSRLGADASEVDRRRAIVILDYVINLEHAGDIIDKGLVPEVEKKIGLALRFSEEGYRELNALFLSTLDNIRIAQTIFMSRDRKLARQLVEAKVQIRHMERQSAERHFDRLSDGHAASLHTSSLHLDMLRDLKRVNAHIFSVAYPILDEEGMLVESRLKAGAEG
ncbi:Na/Pi cotransporter family protein [Solirhodobacter olei]|uniref:Na/Pi cotransporter family protein n=1 Tax=Solirhodobacter olei TaxID=2493082 RepID=UPI000FDA679D|nr:Na/Pi cotransporter family protein [Solirhodobacter olei]